MMDGQYTKKDRKKEENNKEYDANEAVTAYY